MANAPTLSSILEAAYNEDGLTYEDVVGHKGYLDTGNIALNYILGGGVPRGRTTEFSGPSQSGKTTAAAMTAASCQRVGMPVLYLDYEQALDTAYLQALGVDTEDRKLFLPFPAASLEDGADVATRMIDTGKLGCVIFDSVAAMTPKKIIEEDGESRTTGMERARLLTNLLNKMNPALARTGTAAIFINHERTEVNTAGGRPGMPPTKTTVGGTALKYYSSTRVRFGVWKTFKGDRVDPLTGEKISEPHSVLTKAKVTKNKTGTPFGEADLYLELGKGFSNPYAAIQVLVGAKIIKKAPAGMFYFPEDLLNDDYMKRGEKGPSLQGIATILDVAGMSPEWSDRLTARAQAVLAPHTNPMAERKLVDDPDGPGTPMDRGVEDLSESEGEELAVQGPPPVPKLSTQSATSISSDDLSGAFRLV